MKYHPTKFSAILGIGFASLLLTVTPARAQLEEWNGSMNTDWFTGTNWTPNTPPGGPAPTDNVQVDTTSPNITVVGGGGAATARSLNVGTNSGDVGEVRVRDNSTLAVGVTDFNIGNGGTGTVVLRDTSATTVAQNMVLAVQTGSSGDLTVRDTATLKITGQLRVGDLGTGTLTIRDSTSVTANHMDVGTFSTEGTGLSRVDQ